MILSSRLGITAAALVLISQWVATLNSADDESMEPTICRHTNYPWMSDIVLVDKLTPMFLGIGPGDVICFRYAHGVHAQQEVAQVSAAATYSEKSGISYGCSWDIAECH
jgi:signal peptidase I